jgi:hypothetical protein
MKSRTVESERFFEVAELQDLAPSYTYFLVKARSAREAHRLIEEEGDVSDAVVESFSETKVRDCEIVSVAETIKGKFYDEHRY